MNSTFDYEKKVWSAAPMAASIFYIQYLHFLYASKCLNLLKEGDCVLDLGCGGGSLTAALAKKFPHLNFTGVDISQNAVNNARRFTSSNLNFVKVPREEPLPFNNGSFKAILLVDVLEHTKNPDSTLSLVDSVLSDDGYIYASIPTEGVWWCLHFWMRKLGWQGKLEQSGHIQNFTPKDLLSLFRKHQFERVFSHWGFHLISQLLDFLYSLFWIASGRQPSMSLEGYRNAVDRGLMSYIITSVTKVIFAIMNLESLVFKKVPGMGWHVVFKRRSLL